ncbi:hypothetical protein UG55_103527 [Frankia sp. EI5c]|uniref:hypothetical protein n=1 Tax=Frankia sp. EI5c TaxID=683316 RepID=UPI0007C2D93B|nr:hypothetical protein [Frankia sp. EI5c]OAA23593.1 hypothetical protein UG55_103527 [Frankia sp. EI5c]
MAIPAAPKGAGPAGRRLWRSVLDEYDLAEHELSLLRRAVHVADVCADLERIVADEGLIIRAQSGDLRTHPAAVELRQQTTLLARLIVALRVPLGDADEAGAGGDRPPVRAVRGVYQPRVIAGGSA